LADNFLGAVSVLVVGLGWLIEKSASTAHLSKDPSLSHSPENIAIMFWPWPMIPDLRRKLSCFVALAPAVYAGLLKEEIPFGAIKSMQWRSWMKTFLWYPSFYFHCLFCKIEIFANP
jgi:hypothetical protein